MFFLCALLTEVSSAWADPNPTQHKTQAILFLERRNYEKSSILLNHLMLEHNGTAEAVEAKILMADLFFQKQEWPTARIYYQQFLRDHPSHPEAPRALYRVGETHNKDAPKDPGRDQRATEAAIRVWKQFLIKYSQSPYRTEVEAKIAEGKERLAQKELDVAIFYSKKEKWEAVRRRSQFLMNSYPNSTLFSEALFLNTLAHVFLGQMDRANLQRETLLELSPQWAAQLETRIQKGK